MCDIISRLVGVALPFKDQVHYLGILLALFFLGTPSLQPCPDLLLTS